MHGLTTNEQNKHGIIVIGHKNPDTDSICSAVAYADLKNKISEDIHVPARAGDINAETEFVLKRFGVPIPEEIIDVSPQVQDIDIRRVKGVSGDMTLRRAWETMRDTDISALPITDENSYFQGLITLQDVAMANMDRTDVNALSDAKAKLRDVIDTISGTLVVGDPDTVFESGKLIVGAGSPDVIESAMEEGDIVIVADRYDSQLCAIEMGASCIIICLAPNIAKTIKKIAEEHDCAIITTPFDTYAVCCLINQSIPIRRHMALSPITFKTTTPVEEARAKMGSVRYHYFPIIDTDNKYCGVISRRNLINLKRKRLILVDHNERSQCVDGCEKAELLEVIDHHRIGDIETSGPVYFRNQPVGCTATIVSQIYRENNIEIPANIAGILCSAIISDTLAFTSPTCTPIDREIAGRLAEIAGIDPDEYAEEMFAAGENIEGKTAGEILRQDFKVFESNDVCIGIGQASYINPESLKKVQALIAPEMEAARRKEHVDAIFFMLTDVRAKTSLVLFEGRIAGELVKLAFGKEPDGGMIELDGIVSRKKQLVPPLVSAVKKLEL